MKGVIVTGLLEPVLKHPGHGDQKVHGRKGGTADSDSETHQVMRGVAMNLPSDVAARVETLLQPPSDESEIDQHLKVGPILLDQFQRGGGGAHWTGNARGIAEIGAGARRGGNHLPMIVHAEYKGSRREAGRSALHDEDEHTIPRGTAMRVTGIEVKTPSGWLSVLSDPVDIVLGEVRKAVEPMLKHPGHADQKVHGRRGGGSVALAEPSRTSDSDLPAGWSRRSPEDVRAEFERKAIDEWETTPEKAREYAESRAASFDYYDGPGGSTVVIEAGRDVPPASRDRLMQQVVEMQKVAPLNDVVVEVGLSAYRYHGEDARSTFGFTYLGRSNIFLAPRTVKQGIETTQPDWLMPSANKNRRFYALAHEWGHALDRRSNGNAYDDWVAVSKMSGMSKYGRSNARESFAEAFVEWHLTGGNTSSEGVAYYREKYNWGSEGGVTVAKAVGQTVTIIADTFSPDGAMIRENVILPNPVEWALSNPLRKSVTIAFAPGLRPVLKHGNHNQKDHGRRGGSLKPEVAASILERVKANGGLSVNMLDGSEPTSGFMVAKGGDIGDIVPADKFFDPVEGPKALGSFLKANRDTLTKGSYLGLWHNTEDGNVYLDVSDNILDRGTAERAGRDRNQISIWDVANFQEINTGGTGELAKTASGDPDAGPVEDDGRGDRRLRADSVGEVHRPGGVVVGFEPGFRPILKHGSHNQQSHAGGNPASSFKGGDDDEPQIRRAPKPSLADELEAQHEATARALLDGDYKALNIGSSRLVQAAGGAVGRTERRIADFAARYGARFRKNKRRTYTAEEAAALRESYYEQYGRPTWMQKAVAWLKGLFDE